MVRSATVTWVGLAPVAAGTLGLFVEILYAAVIYGQGATDDPGRPIFFGSLFLGLAAVSLCAGALLLLGHPSGRILAIAAAAGYLASGFLALFSIGLLLIAAGVLNLVGMAAPDPDRLSRPAMLAAVVLPIALVAAGAIAS